MKASHLFLGALIATLCVQVSAQWQWLDRDGRKVFSDRAPPPEIPEKNILKRPGKAAVPQQTDTAPAAESSGAAPAAAAALPTPKKSELDLKLEEKKKQAEQAEAAKRRAEEERVTKARAENCERARKAKAALDSGVRMATTNAQGEREVMDDAARASERQRIQTVITSDCR